MPVSGKLIGKYGAMYTKGSLVHYGATQKYSYYTSDINSDIPFFSTEHDLIYAKTWDSNEGLRFPKIPHNTGIQYDPYTDTFIRNDGNAIVEIDYIANTTVRTITVSGIPEYGKQNAILIGIGGESHFYYLVKSTGELYKINRDFIGAPELVGSIPTGTYAATGALGGFFFQENLYLLNNLGNIVEVSITKSVLPRIVISGLYTNTFLFPLLTYYPEMVLKRKLFFTVCSLRENIFQLCQIDLGQPPNPPIPISYIGTREAPFVYGLNEPWFSWNFSDPDSGDRSTAYQVVVMDGETSMVLHDTDKVPTGDSRFIYNGPTLFMNHLYKWRVRVWDVNNMESNWCVEQYFIPNERLTIYELTGTRSFDSVTVGLTPRLSFKVVDNDTKSIQGYEITIKQIQPVEKIVLVNTYVETPHPWFDVPDGLLQEMNTYQWEVRAKDRFGVWGNRANAYFRTTSIPPAPFLLGPSNGIRTDFTPVFHAAINGDPIGDHQHFRIQLASDQTFAQVIKTFYTIDDPQGWEVFDGEGWQPFPMNGVRRSRQLVENFDFSIHGDSYGTISCWGVHNYWGYPDRLEMTELTPEGTRSLRIVNESGKNRWEVRQLLKGWKSGDKLKITLDARLVRIGSAAALKVMLKSEEGLRLNETVLSLSTVTEEYQTYIGEVIIPDDQTLDMLFLSISLEGNQSAGSECHIRSVTAEVLYVVAFQEVRYTPPAALPADRYWWRMEAISAEQMTVSTPTNEIRLVNQFRLLNESYTDPFQLLSWHYGFEGTSEQYDYQIELFPNGNPDGSHVIEARAVSENTRLKLSTGFRGDAGKFYLCMMRVKSNYAFVPIEISGQQGPHLSVANRWQTLYMKRPGGASSLAFSVTPLQSESDQVTSLSNVCIYEISQAEYERIDVDPAWSGDNLLLRYPYVHGELILQQPRYLSTGDELSFHLTAPVRTTKAANFLTLNAVWKHPSQKSQQIPVPFDALSITYEHEGSDWMVIGDEATITTGMGSSKLSFWGTGIRWHGKKTPHSYIAYVLIDDVFISEIDQYAETAEETVLFEKTDLPYGQHSITVITTNFANPSCEQPVYRTHIRAFEVLLNEPAATIALHACNNGFDSSPVWEDLTDNLLNGTTHTFVNKRKTASKWGVNVRLVINASGTLSPVEVDGFGFSFE